MAKGGRVAVVTLFVFLTLAHASDDASKCNAGCHGSSKPTGGYLPGTAYTYAVEGLAKVQLSSADKQETTVKLAALAVVTGIGNCAHLLKITSLQITGPDGTVYQKPRNIDKAVRFTLQDGVLGSNICAEQDDNQASINIKRAIVSMLQTANKHNTEVDVFGVCPTSFKVHKEGGNIVITKYRDLNTCSQREQGKHDLITSIYNPNAEIKSANILDSNLRVETVLKNGVVQKSEAIEDYLYVPFSTGSSGAKAQVNTKVTLKETKAGFNIQANCVVPKSVIFENPHLMNTDHGNTDKIQLALKTASQSMEQNVNSKSASVFMNLVRILRVSNKNDIQSVYNQIKGGSSVQNNSFLRRVFLDALFRAGTGDSVEVLVDLVQKKELSPMEQKLAFISLATVQHASSSSIKASIKLLDMPNMPESVYLGVGALAGAYCRDHTCHGATSQDANIAALSNKLASKLGNCKAKDKKSETMLVYALKGIRNIHHLEDSIIAKLASCASDKTVKQRVRIAALETFSADPCTKQLKTTALSILKDTQQDSEVRIKAYLALLDCPCANVAGELKKILDDEPVYQVGAFISSSLSNIRSSANPSRRAAKEHFGLIHPKKKYPFDVRKFSQNYEFSYEYEMLGIGSVADANVIYSQDSYLPRSANLNLTTEIFGRNINLIELGYRQGNLDRIFEEYFGPHGFVKTHTPQEIYKDVKRTTFNVFDKIKQRMQETRGKRSVLQQTNNFKKQLKHSFEDYNGNVDLDIFLKMFGSEVVFLSLGDDKPMSIETLIDKFFDMMDSTIADAKQFTHEIRNHMILLDSELAFPTSTGFVLKLNAEAVSATKVQFAGNVDLRQIMNDPKNSKIDIKLIPSANIEAAGTLMIDADVVATGLKVMSSLHTSTGTHVIAKLLDNGQGFDMQLGLPIDKQEFITANHEIMYITRPKGSQEIVKDIKFDASNRYQFSGCFDQLSNAIGLTLCSDISIPWQPMTDTNNNNKKTITTIAKGPLSGPAKVAIRLEKEDLNGFHIIGTYKTVKNSQKILDVTVEANGSKKNRKVSFVADVINRDDRRSMKLSLTSPVSAVNLEAETAMINSDSEKSLMARFAQGESEYSGKIGMLISGSQAKQTYTPVIDIKVPQENKGSIPLLKTEGSITRTQSGQTVKFTANNLKLKGTVDLTTEGWWQYEGANGQVDLKFSSDKNKFTLAGKYKAQENSYSGNWDVRNTINPNFDFHLDVNAATKENTRTFNMDLVHGPNPTSKTNKITYSSTLRTQGDSDTVDFYFKNKFNYPLWQLDFETLTEIKPKKFKTELEGSYEKRKAEFAFEVQRDMKTEGDFYGKFKTKVNEDGIGTEFKFDVTGEDKGNFIAKLDLYPTDKHEATGNVNYHMSPDDTNVGFSVKYKNSGKPNEFKFDIGLVKNSKLYNSFCKMSLGNNDYIDFVFNVNQGPAPSGNLKLILKDVVKCDGQFKVNAQDKKGNGVLLIAFLKPNRKMKIDTNFLMSEPQYNINVDIYYDHEKDNSKKISLVSNNKIAGESIDSKSSLTSGSDKLDFTFKGDVSFSGGPFFAGKQNFLSTLTCSNGQSVSLKVDRQLDSENDIIGHIDTQLNYIPTKDGKPYKFGVQGKINTQNKLDFEDRFTFVKPSGEDLDFKVHLKRTDKDSRSVYENQLEFTGALMPNTLSYYGSFDMNNDDNEDMGDVKYRVKAAYGPKASLDATGKLAYDTTEGSDTSYKNDIDATLVLPFENAHNIKFTFNNMYFEPKDESHVEIKSTLGAQVNANSYKYDLRGLFGENNGEGKFSVQVPNYDKISVLTSFKKTEEEGKPVKYNNKFSLEYGNNQKFTYTINGESVLNENGNFVIDMELPSNFKQAKTVKYEVKYKVGNEITVVDTVGYVDDKKYTFYYNTDFTNPNVPIIEFKGSCPDNKPFRFYLKANALNIDAVKAETKMENFGKFNLDMNIDAMLRSADEFRVKVNIDCEQLNLKKIQFEAFNEGESKGVKKIQFMARENNKNVLSGSTTYQSRREGGKYIMEGSGSFKLRDQQKSTSFKYIRDKIAEENEKGVEVFFNVALGEKNVAIEYKNTNIAYKLSSTYCEEKKQCANIDINNKLDSTDNSLLHDLQVSIDLRKLGFIPEFGLKSHTEWSKSDLPTHTFDVHLNLDKSKYHTQAYAKPVKGNYQTALTMTLPQRVISLESSTSYGKFDFKQSSFPFHHEIVFYKNKNANPQAKSIFKINSNLERIPGKHVNVEGEVLLSCPMIGKDLQISGRSKYDVPTHEVTGSMIFDIFKKKSQKVVVSGKFHPKINDKSFGLDSLFQIQGNELGFDLAFVDTMSASTEELKVNSKMIWTLEKQKKESVFVVDMNRNRQKMQIKYPGMEIFNYESNVKTGKGVLVDVQGTITFFQKNPATFLVEVKNEPHSFKISTGRDNNKFVVTGMYESIKKAEIRAEFIEGKQQKNLASVGMKTENKSVKPDVHVNDVNIKHFVTQVNNNLIAFVKSAEEANKKIQEDVTKDIKKTANSIQHACIDFSEVSKKINEEVKKISTELESDKTLQELMKSTNEVVKAVAKVVSEFIEKATGIMQETMKFLTENFNHAAKLFQEQIVPELSKLYAKISETVVHVTENIVNLVTFYITSAMEYYDKHRAEFQPMIDALNSIFNDVSQLFLKQVDKIGAALKSFFVTLKEYFDKLPMISELGDHLKQLEIPEKITTILDGTLATISPFIPTDELKQFFDRVADYIKIKLTGEPCDDLEQLKLIFSSLETALDSLVKYIKTLAGNQDLSFDDVPKPNFIKFSKIPKAGVPSFSVLNYLEREKLPTVEEIFMAYRPKSFNPLELIPPYQLKGLIAGGQHVFTFDGRHMTFPGSCKYVVSQDAVDGNFSMVITLDKGIAKSINVVDKSGADVEVNLKNELIYNGSPYGFPLIKGSMIAYRNGDSFTIESNYGARVRCSLNLDMCYFEVSGFYLGKLRGFLGDGNNEPYDDFRLPNGKITTSESEFGNAYALNSGCAQVKTVDHSHHHGHTNGHSSPGICNKIFSKDSELSLCFYALNPDNFKQACQHATQGVPENKAHAEGCLIARAYATACKSIAFHVLLPDVCNQCQINGMTYKYEEEMDIAVPQNQADIILTVETTKANEKTFKEMVVPLMSSITEELKKNKINDVKVHLVGIMPKLPYPVFYDVPNNAIQKSKIDFKDEQRSKPWEAPITTENEKVDNVLNSFAVLLQKAEIELGLNSIHTTYARLGKLQLRPKSVKSIIMVHSEACPEAIFPLIQMFGSSISEYAMKDQGVVAHLITPLEGLKVANVKQNNQVVGFSEDHVFVLGDKKRGLSHAALRSGVVYDDDVCMSHALETFGNVYSSKNFLSCNNNQKKAFITMTSQTIVDSLVQVSLDRKCSCDLDIFSLETKVKCTVIKRSDKRKAGSKK